MRALLTLLLMSTLAQTEPAPPPSPSPPAPAFRLIVHRSNPVTELERRFVEDVFLKKIKSWHNGDAVRPVDLEPNSPVRRRFTEVVLRRPLAAVRAYWQQRIFSGRDVPPPELDNDQQVLRYVARYPGAIGYVSGGARLDGVKAVDLY
jgi:ABC-type phosphate transport system substrate-binding protein